MESSSESDTEISIVPWLDLILIDLSSLLVALYPAISVRILFEPLHILAIGGIICEFFFATRIEEIYCEPELMFTISRWSTERVTASPEIPESLLVGGTAITTDDGEWRTHIINKSCRHIPECISSFSSELTIATSLVDE